MSICVPPEDLDTLSPPSGRRVEIARRLTRPLVLEDGRPPRLLVATLLTASGFVIAAIVLISGIKILKEYQRAVIFRLGRLVASRGPGISAST